MKKIIITLVLLTACMGNQNIKNPEGVLQKFVESRFKGTKVGDLKNLVSDKYFESIQEMRDTKYDTLDHIKKKKFKLISKNCSEVNCKITYYVSYGEYDGKKKQSDTETKKIATLIPNGETWLIDQVDHIKTYHDMGNHLEVDDSK